jgi:hypothetical protein
MTKLEKIEPEVAIRYMGSLLRRTFIVLWFFWLVFCVTLSLYGLVKVFTITNIEFPRVGLDTTASITVPESVVTAYKSGIMSAEAKREFQRDIRSGFIVPPKGTHVIIPSEELDIFDGSVALLAVIGIPLVVIIVLQYLVFGFTNPQRLFRRSGSIAIQPN